MLDRILKYNEKHGMIVPGDTIAAGVSGGADSVCLLFTLLEIKNCIPFKLVVVHVHHGIREEADQEADYVKSLCKTREIPFYLVREDVLAVAKKEKLSIEEAGRQVRYRAFYHILEEVNAPAGKVAVAHNRNDRAETMLFHLFRGSGIKGMAGIRPVRDNIIRPLLCVDRQEIEKYLQAKGIKYYQDASNNEDTYTRNRIRHHILPYAEENICRGSIRHMTETAEQFMEIEDYLMSQTQKAAEKCVDFQGNGIIIDVKRLLEQEGLLQKRILLFGLAFLVPGRRDITAAHVAGLMDLLKTDGSRQISLPYGLSARKEYQKLMLERNTLPVKGNHTDTQEIVIPVPGKLWVAGLGEIRTAILSYEKNMIIPQKKYTKYFDYDKITTSLVLRVRKKGDFIKVNAGLSTKSIQDYMVNEKIPREKRDRLLLVADDSHIMWIPGYRISQQYKVGENTKTMIQITIKGENTNDRESQSDANGSGSGCKDPGNWREDQQ